MANRTRNIVLRVPVTAEERAMIERKMQQMGTGCFSVYARKMLIDGYVIRLDYSDVKAMTAELQKIGTNINQIAKRVNATGTLYAQDIEDIKGAMAEIWQLQRSILSKAPYDEMNHPVPEAIWWISGSKLLVPPFIEGFLSYLREYLKELEVM